MMPVDAVVAVTWRCNARCGMCGIWKIKAGEETPPEVFGRLPSSLRDVNLTGGEPFLRPDLPAVHEAVRTAAPRARTILSTNGLATEKIITAVRTMSAIEQNIGLAISLDGPPEIHDRQRGIPGAYDHVLRTVKELQHAGFNNLRLAFTATAQNTRHLRYVYDLSRELGVEFTCTVQHSSEHYFHSAPPEERIDAAALREQLLQVMRRELATWSPKRWARAFFMNGQFKFVTEGKRPFPCYAGRDFFFMDPDANIFTCNAAPWKMGNLAERTFDELWNSPDAREMRERAMRCRNGCWMVCSARTAMLRSLPTVLAWAVRAKISPPSLRTD